MRTLHVAFLTLVCAAGLDASAQSPTALEQQATALASACLSTQPTTPETAGAAIVACEKLISDVEALRQANLSASGHDRNVFLIVKGMGETRVAASYGKIDGVRSARVCAGTERSWTLTAQVNKAESPGYAAMIDQLVGSAIPAITKCRQEFGTPVGATPLPAS